MVTQTVQTQHGANARSRRVRLLGGFAVERDGHAVVLPASAQRVVAYLALFGPTARGRLAGTLWPDVSQPHAFGCLRSALWRIEHLEHGLVSVRASTAELDRRTGVDARELVGWARASLLGCSAAARPVPPPPAALSGELLPDWDEEWVVAERERIRQLRLHALESLAVLLSGQGRFVEALEAAYAAVSSDPLRESARRALVQVHLDEGNLAEAVREVTEFAALLDAELGVRPTDALVGLVRRARLVQAGRSSPARERLQTERPAVGTADVLGLRRDALADRRTGLGTDDEGLAVVAGPREAPATDRLHLLDVEAEQPLVRKLW